MSLTGNNAIVGSGFAGNQPFSIDQSLRFNGDDSAYLSATQKSGTTTTWTFSSWVKRCELSAQNPIFTVGADNTNDFLLYFLQSTDVIDIIVRSGSSIHGRFETTQVFRDTSAWYHIVFVYDSTNATSTERMRLYVNGERVTAFNTETYPSQNQVSIVNNSSYTMYLGQLRGSADSNFDGYLADVNLIDGQALTPASFGETDSDTNQWVPIKYASGWGTNGFYLPFSNGSDWSYRFDGNGDWITVPSNSGNPFDFGTGDFTIEGWFYTQRNGSATYYWGISQGGGASQKINFGDASGNGTLGVDINGTTVINSSTVDTLDKWVHLAVVREGTGANQLKLYANGTLVGSGTSSVDFTSFTANFVLGHNGEYWPSAAAAFDGYISNFRVVKGTAVYTSSFTPSVSPLTAISGTTYLTAQSSTFVDNSSLGQTVTVNGNTYADKNSSFQLDFADDHSGNANNFAPNNLNYNDVVIDIPTNNFATLNPLDPYHASSSTFTEGNLKATEVGGAYTHTMISNLGMSSGKWYFEFCGVNSDNTWMIGLCDISLGSSRGYTGTPNGGGQGLYLYVDGDKYYPTLSSSYGTSWTYGDVIGVAVDLDNNAMYFAKNNTWMNSGDPTSGSSKTGAAYTTELANRTWAAAMGRGGYSNTIIGTFNFGQDSSFASAKTAQGNGGVGEDFYYTPPTGYKALNTNNLDDPSIDDPTKHFNTILWSGNAAATRSFTGVGFSPDFVWSKNRTRGDVNHQLYDTVRGTGKAKALVSAETYSEDSGSNNLLNYGQLSSFDSDGFSVSDGSQTPNWNFNNTTGGANSYVAWNWKAGDTPSKTYAVTVTNPGSGNRYTLDTRVSGTNAIPITLEEGGTYTFDQADNSNSGHPLRFSTTSNGTHGGGSEYTTGVTTNGTPGSAGAYTRITVAASAPTLYYYCTNHSGMGAEITTPATGSGVSNLDGTIASVTNANTTAGFSIVSYTGNGASGATIGHGLSQKPELVFKKNRSQSTNFVATTTIIDGGNDYVFLNLTNAFGNSAEGVPTSSVIPVYPNAENNSSGDNFICYAFHSVEGYSKIGSYTGNGSTDGTFVYTGFRPAFILWKSASAAENWQIQDNKMNPYNVVDKKIFANTTASEYTGAEVDFVSNGFKLRHSGGGGNGSSETLVYLAFAESPFKYSNAR